MSLRVASHLVTAAIVFAVAGAVACSGSAPSKKSSSAKCSDAKKCPAADSNAPSEGDEQTGTDDPAITSAPDPSTVTTAAEDSGTATDAGAKDSGAKDSGSSTSTECAKLAACCDQIVAAGEDDSICRSVVSMHSESNCSSKHADYKSFGDCT
jgi:hypothetical protein